MSKNINDLTGKQFNRWTVISFDCIGENGKTRWLCECSCDMRTRRSVVGNNLTTGLSISCGCYHKENLQLRSNNIENKKYGKLTAIKKISAEQNIWLFRCDCGTELEELAIRITGDKGRRYCGECINKYFFEGDYVIVFDSKMNSFYIDLNDYETIKPYTWIVSEGYVSAIIGGVRTLLHRFLMKPEENQIVDHIDRIYEGTDNRRNNLRICTHKENNMNRSYQSNNKSGVIGVRWHSKYNKWYAHIGIDRKQVHLGSFDRFEDASKAS